MDEAEYAQVKELKQAYDVEKTKNLELQKMSSSLFSGNNNQRDMIAEQLDVSDILERAEHIVKGDDLTIGSDGSITWKTPEDKNRLILNPYGAQLVMKVLVGYVNKNTLLGNYTEQQINRKMLELGNKLRNLFYTKYETMGLDTSEKRKLYPLLVIEIIDMVHGAYVRALNGEERSSLRTQMYVTQNQPLGENQNIPGMQKKSNFSLVKPWTWGNA